MDSYLEDLLTILRTTKEAIEKNDTSKLVELINTIEASKELLLRRQAGIDKNTKTMTKEF